MKLIEGDWYDMYVNRFLNNISAAAAEDSNNTNA